MAIYDSSNLLALGAAVVAAGALTVLAMRSSGKSEVAKGRANDRAGNAGTGTAAPAGSEADAEAEAGSDAVSGPESGSESGAKSSIHDQIVAQMAAAPGEPINPAAIQTDEPEEDGVQLAPGLADAFWANNDDKNGAKKVLTLIRQVAQGTETDWRAIDAITADIPVADSVDKLLGLLRNGDITPDVKARFWELAEGSRRIASVKWGIAIGGLDLQRTELEPLLALAQHAEFTVYAAHVLRREGMDTPEYHQRLVDLLPAAQQWGLVSVINYIMALPELIESVDVQRAVLRYGMENHDGIAMELAFTVASGIDLGPLLREARTDERTFRAAAELMDTLMLEPDPLGGLADLEDGNALLADWMDILEARPGSARSLISIDVISRFLRKDDPPSAKGETQLARDEPLWEAKYAPTLLEGAMDDEQDRWGVLFLVESRRLTELLPAVRQAHGLRPDIPTIQALTAIGEREDLEVLLASIPVLVDVEERRGQSLISVNVFDSNVNRFEYGLVLRSLGRLATPDALAAIGEGMSDYDPYIRSNACQAAADIVPGALTPELADLIRLRLADPVENVAEAAGATADAHGLR